MPIMAAPRKYPDELRERATRLAIEARKDPAGRAGAIKRVADQLDVHPEALRGWVKRAETGVWGVLEEQAGEVEPFVRGPVLGDVLERLALFAREALPQRLAVGCQSRSGAPAVLLGCLPQQAALLDATGHRAADDRSVPSFLGDRANGRFAGAVGDDVEHQVAGEIPAGGRGMPPEPGEGRSGHARGRQACSRAQDKCTYN
ncbi:transposase [Streptomyces sp. NBC_00846]|uniref:transposase n=1 Tax=Streptomyces sp. NBC_00846 TaxID=2975849 RepID=UPI003869F039